MTPEQAAAKASFVLEQAAALASDPPVAAALVAVAGGWTRLYAALAEAGGKWGVDGAVDLQKFHEAMGRSIAERHSGAIDMGVADEDWDGHPAPVGYILVQTGWGGEDPELCAHGPDPVDQEPERLLAALSQKQLRPGERLVLCKLIPMASARSTLPPNTD